MNIKTYSFQEKYEDTTTDPFAFILFIILCFGTCGLPFYIYGCDAFKECCGHTRAYKFVNAHNLQKTMDLSYDGVDKTKSIKSMSAISNLIDHYKSRNKGFELKICNNKFDRQIMIKRKNRVVLSRILYFKQT